VGKPATGGRGIGLFDSLCTRSAIQREHETTDVVHVEAKFLLLEEMAGQRTVVMARWMLEITVLPIYANNGLNTSKQSIAAIDSYFNVRLG
jgi:hypothetical protein